MAQEIFELSAKLHMKAGRGRQQLQDIIRIVRELFVKLGYSEGEDVARQASLQTEYAAAMKAFRATMAECCSLAAEVEHVDDAQPGASTAAPMESSDAPAAGAPAAQLQTELCLKNEALKQLIDQLRQMLESMCMWESHKYQLERIRQVEGSA